MILRNVFKGWNEVFGDGCMVYCVWGVDGMDGWLFGVMCLDVWEEDGWGI